MTQRRRLQLLAEPTSHTHRRRGRELGLVTTTRLRLDEQQPSAVDTSLGPASGTGRRPQFTVAANPIPVRSANIIIGPTSRYQAALRAVFR